MLEVSLLKASKFHARNLGLKLGLIAGNECPV